MSDYNDLIDILKYLLTERFYPMPAYTKGVLGDGNGNVQVPDRPDKSYARFNRGSSEYFEIFNVTVPQVNDWPVKIGEFPWAPGLTQVVGTDWEVYEQSGWGNLGNTPAHAPTHEWPDGSPGADPMNVHLRSIVPFRAYSLTGTTVYVNSLEYEYQGSGHVWSGLPGISLQPVISDTVTGTMRYAGVYLDPTTNVLGVVTGATTVHSSALTPPLVQFPAGKVPAARFRIYGNQTVIRESDTVDARRPFNPVKFYPVPIEIDSGDSPYTAAGREVIVCDTTAGGVTLNLPSVSGIAGRRYTIANVGSGTVTISPDGSELIEGISPRLFSGTWDTLEIIATDSYGWIKG